MNPKERSFGEEISGGKLTIEQRINKAQEEFRVKKEEGWHYTCLGWLSPKEIEEAGLVWSEKKTQMWNNEKNEIIEKAIGYMNVPFEAYMIENTNQGKVGTKYFGPTRKFMKWYKKKFEVEEDVETHIQKEIKQQQEEYDDNPFKDMIF